MADITPFNFGAHTVRVVTHNNQYWFVATDVAATLGYRNAPDILMMMKRVRKLCVPLAAISN